MDELVDKIILLFDLTDNEDTRKGIINMLEETCTKHNINIRILEENFKHLITVVEKISLSVKEIIVFFGEIADVGIRGEYAVSLLPEYEKLLKGDVENG